MALDKGFSLLDRGRALARMNVPRLSSALQAVHGRPCIFLVAGDDVVVIGTRSSDPRRWDGEPEAVAFAVPALPVEHALRAFEEARTNRLDPYGALAQAGILALSPARFSGTSLVLSGGSLSAVTLGLDGDEMVVTKEITGADDVAAVDGLARHRAEAGLLRHAADNDITLFTQLRNLSDEGGTVSFSTQFFPAYTAAELVFQGRMSGEQLGEVVVAVYEALRRDVYRLSAYPTSSPHGTPSYVETIRRRAAAMPAPGAGTRSAIHDAMHADEVVVNGIRCVPYAPLLKIVETDHRWQQVLVPRGPRRLCHGDLILEDILVRDIATQDFKLVDPNPYNCHPWFDVAKTLLSLLVGYEFFYFDQFEIDVDQHVRNRSVTIHLRALRGEYLREYSTASKILLEYLESESGGFLGSHGPDLRYQLRMAAALHALAIPWFHLTHHRREDRAVAFLAAGLYHATAALHRQEVGAFDEGTWL